MKKSLLLLLFLTGTFLMNAQSPCTDGRYASDVFSDFTLTSDIEFGQNATWTGGQYTLKMDALFQYLPLARRSPFLRCIEIGRAHV